VPDPLPPVVAPPLPEALRTRGRRLAIASHPAGNTFRMIFSQHLPTLALVGLGASELQVGLQSSFVFLFIALQLPTLRAVGHFSKRTILLASHGFALVAALPLVFWSSIESLPGAAPVGVAMASFALVAVGLCVGETVWFPLLRGFVEPERIGRFFGTLRTGWHLALILFYAASQRWLEQHPGGFGALFGAGFALGAIRTFLIARLPERSERTGERIRAREALALARDPRVRGYLLTVAWTHAVRVAAVPFAIVMLRRVGGVSDGDVIYTTVAFFTGGLVSLYGWGRVVDRAGAVPVLRATLVGQALVIGALAGFTPGDQALLAMVVWFFAVSVLAAGFGLADTHLLFGLAPPEAPARTLVVGAVVVGTVAGLAPVLAGAALEGLLTGEGDLSVYRGFFAVLGATALLALLPLRRLAAAAEPQTS
jgi:predicted MFS family arabinose efflux permease